MRRLRRVTLWTVGVSALIFSAWVAWAMFEMFYYQAYVGVPLNRDLGFTHGSPYIRCGGWEREVFTIESVTPGGIFDRAGFRKGDIVRGLSFTGFYKLLHRSRGQTVTIEVVDGGEGPSLDERSPRHLTFCVPMSG